MKTLHFFFGAILIFLNAEVFSKSLVPYIYGGLPAKEGQFPYQAFMECFGHNTCSGVILSDRWIITASHCVHHYTVKKCLVGVGSTTVDNATKYGIIDIGPFDKIGVQYVDIALLKTTEPIIFSDKVQPIELSEDFIEAGVEGVISGWGLTENGQTKDLRYTKLRIFDHDKCHEVWKFIMAKAKFKPKITINEGHICTIAPVGVGTCRGDSGGPLVIDGKLVGITSFGLPCAKGAPDVFTRISWFKKWIDDHINDCDEK